MVSVRGIGAVDPGRVGYNFSALLANKPSVPLILDDIYYMCKVSCWFYNGNDYIFWFLSDIIISNSELRKVTRSDDRTVLSVHTTSNANSLSLTLYARLR